MTHKCKIFGEMTPRFSVYVESKGIFQKFYSYKTIGTLNDVKKQTCLAVTIYRVVYSVVTINRRVEQSVGLG